jgi:DNA-binding CsgD family transcriptional regulator
MERLFSSPNEQAGAATDRGRTSAALVCLGLTYKEIGVRLGISAETVKTHIKNSLAKFELHGQAALEQALSGWYFSEWDR